MALAREASFIYQNVQARYGHAAKTLASEYGSAIAKAFGYSEDELASVPRDANLGLSCGNPFALAHIQEVRRLCAAALESRLRSNMEVNGLI